MALTVTVNKYASSNFHLQALHRTQGKSANTTTPTLSSNVEFGRRGLVLSTVIATIQVPDSRTQILKSTHPSPKLFFSRVITTCSGLNC